MEAFEDLHRVEPARCDAIHRHTLGRVGSGSRLRPAFERGLCRVIGKPWSRTTGSPELAMLKCIRMPFTSIL